MVQRKALLQLQSAVESLRNRRLAPFVRSLLPPLLLAQTLQPSGQGVQYLFITLQLATLHPHPPAHPSIRSTGLAAASASASASALSARPSAGHATAAAVTRSIRNSVLHRRARLASLSRDGLRHEQRRPPAHGATGCAGAGRSLGRRRDDPQPGEQLYAESDSHDHCDAAEHAAATFAGGWTHRADTAAAATTLSAATATTATAISNTAATSSAATAAAATSAVPPSAPTASPPPAHAVALADPRGHRHARIR